MIETQMHVTPEVLEQLLLLPSGVHIVGAGMTTRGADGYPVLVLHLCGPEGVIPNTSVVKPVYEADRPRRFVHFEGA